MPKLMAVAEKNFDTDFSPLLDRRYVSIPYGMTKMSTNMVTTLVDITVVPTMAFLSFLYQSVKKTTC